MILLFFALWVVFNGRLTWEIAAFGAVISVALYAFCRAFLELDPKKELNAIRRIPWCLRYLWTLICEIVKSNMAVMKIVYSRRAEVKPHLARFRTTVKGRTGKAVLADSITVTPGTITVLCEDDVLTVHCLDDQFAEGLEDTPFQRLLAEAEAKEGRA